MRFYDPLNDVAFKKVFGSENHKNITISFLNAILEFEGDQIIQEVAFDFMNVERQRLQVGGKRDSLMFSVRVAMASVLS